MMGYGGDVWLDGRPRRMGMFVGLLFWVVLAVLAIWAASAVFGRTPGDTQTDALEILKRRYAAGEITQAEFRCADRCCSTFITYC